MRFRLLVFGLVSLGSVMLVLPPARAEIDMGTYGVRSFDIVDLFQNAVGELVITTSDYTPSGNLSAASEHWSWISTPWLDHFGITPTAEGGHSIDEPFQRYPHSMFPQLDSGMATISSTPKAWRLTRATGSGTSALDVVLAVDQGSGTMTWSAASSALNASRLLDLAEGEQIWFNLITANPPSMQANTSVRVLTAEEQ